MKLQYLTIIFLIIILPIILVLSVYVDYHIDAINLKHKYDTQLLNSTYDALKSYQLNTVNNAISDISASKIDELEAAVKTFYNSLSNTLGYTGYKSSVMEEYVPAVVFTMYDGYYIYSPYRNVLTGVSSDDVDDDYENNTVVEGLKSYVYYSCRYKKDSGTGKKFDIVITYTLDNYITIQGTVDGEYVNRYGYLIDGITKVSDTEYEYDGITFKKSSTECLKEYVGDNEYAYAKLNGTKYYLDGEEVFYINSSGERAVQASRAQNEQTFNKYKNFIEKNNSAYRYYKNAYEFTTWVRENLSALQSDYAVDSDGNSISDFGNYKIFGDTSGKYIQDADSDFNAHRSAVIRYTITKNLSTAIAGYNNYFENSESDFIMPNLSETDWEIIENNISIITFLQGFKIGGRDYNECCVVANNLTKEYIDENDIYILGNNHTYYKVNDTTTYSMATGIGYQPGVWKINFESRIDATGDEEITYYPICYKSGSKIVPYLGSYSSIIASTSVDTSESDMYKYLRATNASGEHNVNEALRTAYYTALGRERYGQYSVNNDVNIIKLIE